MAELTEAPAALAAAFHAGDRVFMSGATGEVPALSAALTSGALPPLDLVASLVPGINPSPGPLPAGTRLLNVFPIGNDPAVSHLPLSYGGFAAWLSTSRFDVCVVHVAPPASGRLASLGPTAEFAPIALRRAARIIAVVNPMIPALPGAPHIDLGAAAIVVEIEAPLREYDPGGANPESEAIAARIAAFVDDTAALQVGLGKVPDALMRLLAGRRGLRMQSGMLSDSVRGLLEAGALDPDWRHMACVHVGSRAHYAWLAGRPEFDLCGVEVTHHPAVLARASGLVAVNGALEVDLFGQANLEFADGRSVSGVGGAADFARAAARDPRGISIVGLPASTRGGRSRIVPRLAGPVSLPRHDVDVVVTDHGAADLRGLDVGQRARALIAVAAPSAQDDLAAAFRELAS